MYKLRNVKPEDLCAVTALEAVCFPPAEAASAEAFAYRITAFPERFFVAEREGEIIGLINGGASSVDTLTDDLYSPKGHKPKGKNQMVFGLAVHPMHQRQGIGAALTSRLAWEILELNKIPFYCAAWSNVKSVRNAIRSGFRPAWVEMTAKPIQTVDAMNHG
jgi:ribosomal protein S18 acetylase RimI-like enzyme